MVAPNEFPSDMQIEPAETMHRDRPRRSGVGIWGVLLALVVLFGYLTAERRAAIGQFVEQVADIIRDFRGYDPEF